MPNKASTSCQTQSAHRAAKVAAQDSDSNSNPTVSEVLKMTEFTNLKIASSDGSVQLELEEGNGKFRTWFCIYYLIFNVN